MNLSRSSLSLRKYVLAKVGPLTALTLAKLYMLSCMLSVLPVEWSFRICGAESVEVILWWWVVECFWWWRNYRRCSRRWLMRFPASECFTHYVEDIVCLKYKCGKRLGPIVWSPFSNSLHDSSLQFDKYYLSILLLTFSPIIRINQNKK